MSLHGRRRGTILASVAKERRDIPLAGFDLDLDFGPGPRCCDRAGCDRSGEFRAPRSRTDLGSYYWFCLQHVREYNAGWDYFRGMSQPEIEAYQRGTTTWHRPTWRMGTGFAGSGARLHDPLRFFEDQDLAADGSGGQRRPRLQPEHRDALAALGLGASVGLQEIKMRYKQLVKRFHPDANPGDRSAEERFKQISAAYRYLLNCGYS